MIAATFGAEIVDHDAKLQVEALRKLEMRSAVAATRPLE